MVSRRDPATPDTDASSGISSPPPTPSTARQPPGGTARKGYVPAARGRSRSTDSSVESLDGEAAAGGSGGRRTYTYPAVVPDVTALPEWAQDFKAARWVACSVDGCDCAGLRPPLDDSPEDEAPIIELGEETSGPAFDEVWRECGACTHGWTEEDVRMGGGHAFERELDVIERIRRRKVAGRLEELLQDKGRVLDFDYSDPDIRALQRQMTSFRHPTSDGGSARSSPDVALIDSRPSKRLRTGQKTLHAGTPSEGDAHEDVDMEAAASKRRKADGDEADPDVSSEDEGPLRQTTQGGRTIAGAAGSGAGGKTSRKGVSAKRPNKGPGGGAGAGKGTGKTSSKGLASAPTREPIQIVNRDGEDVVVDELGNVIRQLDEDEEEADKGAAAPAQAEPAEPQTSDEAVKARQQARDAEAALIDKLATGVSVDADMDSVAGLTQVQMDEVDIDEDWGDVLQFEQLPLKPAQIEFQQDYIRLPVVSSSEPSPQSSIILIGLKNLFQRQLPKMPREYITRLVLDQKHYSMAIVKRGFRVVGGICYRPFESRGFAEIVFCAVESSEQIKGYGSYLMNAVKDHVRKAHPTIHHFLTYADNFAIGYFKKQGFTKEITFPRERWVGYIKDYDSANLMMCKMLPRVRYLEVHQMLHDQKTAVLAKIKTISHSHIVRPGIQAFKKRKPGDFTALPKEQIPGLVESGWDPEIDDIIRRPKRNPQHVIMQQVLTDLQNSGTEWAFGKPVDSNVVVDYYSVITHPMDLQTMEYKLDGNQYDDLSDFINDVKLIVSNCKQYNGEKTSNTYTSAANKLERALENSLKKRQRDQPQAG